MKLPIAAAIALLTMSTTVNARLLHPNDDSKKNRKLQWGPSKNMVERSLASPAITAIQVDIDRLEAANVTAVTAIATANTEITELRGDVVRLEAANVTAVTNIATANAEIAELRSDVVLLEAANVTVNARLEAAEATISAAVATIRALTARVQVLEVKNERIVFVTSEVYTGRQIGGIAGAHSKCQTLADAEGLSGIFKAWLSDSTGYSPAQDFVKSDVPYVNTNGVKVADDWQDLITNDGSGVFLDNPIRFTENKVTTSELVWTGTNVNGMPDSAGGTFCGDWTSISGGALEGYSDSTGKGWTSNVVLSCYLARRLYCFEQ